MIKEALDTLGDDPDAVAATLVAKGIQGVPFSSSKCPIAVYLTEVTGYGFISVGTTTATGSPEVGEFIATGGERVRMPDPVIAFVRRFDGGQYRRIYSEPGK